MKEIQQKKKEKIFNGNYYLIPILFVLCIIPLIMRVHIYESNLGDYAWFPETEGSLDIFLYWKGVALIVCAFFMTGLLIYTVYKEWKKGGKEKIYKEKWLIPLGGFGLLVLLSTLFSKYRSTGFNGSYEQFESVWVVLAYCIVLFYTFYFIRTKKDIDIIEKGLFCVLAVIALLGFTQLLGNDFWETEIGKSLYVPSKYGELRNNLEFNFSGSGNHQVYLTFYNPNYVGVFAAMVLPISSMLCIGNSEWKKRVAWGILTIALFLSALGSGSKAFLISLIATIALGSLLYIRKHIKHLPVIAAILAIGVIIGGCYMKYVNIDLVQYVKNAIVPVENAYNVEDFIVKEDHAELVYKGETLFVQCTPVENGPYFVAWDEDGNVLETMTDENALMSFKDSRFSDITCAIYNGYDEYVYITELRADGHKYAFSSGNEGYTYMNFDYKPDAIVKAEAGVFDKYDTLFSGRGYIWSRTIPLLKENILLGTGADSFIHVFPQNDYIARASAGYQDMLITKPHSMYLQYGVQYGVVALVCFFAVAVIYVIQALKLCWKAEFKDKYSFLTLGFLMGIVGYGIMGISNDSCVALAPMAWVLLGIGFALNWIMKETREE